MKKKVDAIPDCLYIPPVALDTHAVKHALLSEALACKQLYGQELHSRSHDALTQIFALLGERKQMLGIKVTDTSSLRNKIDLLHVVQDSLENEIERQRSPIEDTYKYLVAHDIRIPCAEIDAVASIDSKMNDLRDIAANIDHELKTVTMAQMERVLDKQVKAFLVDIIQFRNDFDANGPGVVGISADEAVVRLTRFQKSYAQRGAKMARS